MTKMSQRRSIRWASTRRVTSVIHVFHGLGAFIPSVPAADVDDVVVSGAAAAVQEFAVDDEGVQDAGVGRGVQGRVDGGQTDRDVVVA